jgi:hypothetical protein
MRHETYREWILLSILDELGEDERRGLDAHVAGCAACREELEEARAYAAGIAQARATVPSEEDALREARRGLREALRGREALAPAEAFGRERKRREERRPMREWFGGFSPARVALAGTAALSIGFLAGYIVFGRTGGMATEGPSSGPGRLAETSVSSEAAFGVRDLGAPSYQNVRLAGIDPRSKQVEIEYDMVRPARLRADIGDERVRRILAQGVTNDANPAARLQAIHTIGAYVEKPQGEEIKRALIRAVKTDPNAGVRKQALYVLYQMPFDDDIKNACLHVLAGDDNEGLRIAAINMLAVAMLDGHVKGSDVVNAVGARLRNDENGYIRFQSGAFLQEVNGHDN